MFVTILSPVGGHSPGHVPDDLRSLFHAEMDLIQVVHDSLELLCLAVQRLCSLCTNVYRICNYFLGPHQGQIRACNLLPPQLYCLTC